MLQVRKAFFFLTTTDLIEWLNSFTRKASNHHPGFESPKNRWSSIFRGNRFFLRVGGGGFVFYFFSRESLMYMAHVNRPIYFIQHHVQEDTILYRYSKDAREDALGK